MRRYRRLIYFQVQTSMAEMKTSYAYAQILFKSKLLLFKNQ
jgi:hypothetical protein